MNRQSDSEKVISDRRFCAYMHRVCQQPRIAGKKYCLRHILEDRDSPFRQCQYVHPGSQRRCRYPAAKTDRREYLCKIHVNKSKKNTKRSMVLGETPRKIFEQLEIYCQKPDHNAQMATTSRTTLKFFDPDSDNEAPLIENCYIYDGDSDAESVDDDNTDYKKNAGVYTAEEVAKITKEKMQRLQTLYFEQFQHLKFVYEARKRDYRYRRQFEKEYVGREFTNPRDERMYKRYTAYRNYRKEHGVDALLKYKMRMKRSQDTGLSSENFCKIDDCEHLAIPLTEFCRLHILNDPDQKLFKACGVDDCTKSVLNWEGHDRCSEHVSLDIDHQKLVEDSLPEGVELRDEPKDFFGVDDIAALGLDAVDPGNLFMLNQSGVSVADGDESTDSAMSEEPRPSDFLFEDDLSDPLPGPSNAPQGKFDSIEKTTISIQPPKPTEIKAPAQNTIKPTIPQKIRQSGPRFARPLQLSLSRAPNSTKQVEGHRPMAALQSAPEFILENTDHR